MSIDDHHPSCIDVSGVILRSACRKHKVDLTHDINLQLLRLQGRTQESEKPLVGMLNLGVFVVYDGLLSTPAASKTESGLAPIHTYDQHKLLLTTT